MGPLKKIHIPRFDRNSGGKQMDAGEGKSGRRVCSKEEKVLRRSNKRREKSGHYQGVRKAHSVPHSIKERWASLPGNLD